MSVASPLLSATTTINAPAAAVWAQVSDLAAMGRRSPQCKKMISFGKPSRMVGSLTININRKGLLWWPTWSIITEWQPDSMLEFRIPLNSSRWRYSLVEVDGSTTVTLERIVDGDTTALSRLLVKFALGGTKDFEAELEQGMAQTLAVLKSDVESRATNR